LRQATVVGGAVGATVGAAVAGGAGVVGAGVVGAGVVGVAGSATTVEAEAPAAVVVTSPPVVVTSAAVVVVAPLPILASLLQAVTVNSTTKESKVNR